MNDLLNDISTRSKSILNRMDEIDVIIKNIKKNLYYLVSKYRGDIHNMTNLDRSKYNEYHTQLNALHNECIKLLEKNNEDFSYINGEK
jgi:hypothetical protein